MPSEVFAARLRPSLSEDAPGLFSELREFALFLWEELKPFPGRGLAVVRLVTAAVATVIMCETLRIPVPSYSAYLVFFIANEEGVSSVKLGLLAMAGLTVALASATAISICFMDAPWFRLPATFLFIAATVWLSRTLVLAVLGRMMAIIFALYLSLADVIFDPEELTEATLWLWSIVGVAVGVSALTATILEPRPDLLLREQIATTLRSVENLLETLAAGRPVSSAQAKALRRQVYAAPQRMKQLLARWRQRTWPAQQRDVDWELGIFIVERLLATSAALAANTAPGDEGTRLAFDQMARTIGALTHAVRQRDRDTIRSLVIPPVDDLPDSTTKAGLIELAVALTDSRLVLMAYARPAETPPPAKAAALKPWALVPDATTNPEYARFAIKTTLAILACEVFMNAVDWPGIRTSMVTCVVTALATVGAQRQKQLLRLIGACLGGLMGLASVIFIVPQLDTIVGLSLLTAAGTACCAWVAAGSVRSSYAGFQMALAFFIVLLPGFETSIDLTAIRDRFVGILVGITATWIFFDHLWHTSSRRQLVDKLIALLHLMAKGPDLVSATASPTEAGEKVNVFRRDLYNALDAGRLLLDETKIELTLALVPANVRGRQLEGMATEVSFAAFLLMALNERKLRALTAGRLGSIEPIVQPADNALVHDFNRLGDAIQQFQKAALLSQGRGGADLVFPQPHLDPVPVDESAELGFELRPLYETLQASLTRISTLTWTIRAIA